MTPIGLRVPLAMVSVFTDWSGGVISSDSICHTLVTFYTVRMSASTLFADV